MEERAGHRFRIKFDAHENGGDLDRVEYIGLPRLADIVGMRGDRES